MSDQTVLLCQTFNTSSVTAIYSRAKREVFISVNDGLTGCKTGLYFNPGGAVLADHTGVTIRNIGGNDPSAKPYWGLDPLIFNHIVTKALKEQGDSAHATLAQKFILASSCVYD